MAAPVEIPLRDTDEVKDSTVESGLLSEFNFELESILDFITIENKAAKS